MRRVLLVWILAGIPLFAQFGKNANAGRIQSKQVQSPLVTTDLCVLAMVDAHSQFECVPVPGGSSGVSGSAPLTFAAIPDGAVGAQVFTLTGAIPGDRVLEGWPATLEAGLTGVMLVTAPNTVQVRLLNQSGFSITPAIQAFSATAGIGAAPLRSVLSFPVIPDGGNAALTFTATGATTAQKVMESWPSTLEAGLVGIMRVPGPNLIEVRLFNFSGFAITPAPQAFGGTLL